MKRLYEVVVIVNEKSIPGDYIECGVYKGGSVMNMAYTQLNYSGRAHIHLYDTFEGMTPPTAVDIDCHGKAASDLMKNSDYSYYCSFDEVVSRVKTTGYPDEFLHYHKGDVAVTLTSNIPKSISILRLDTDWYESTKIELDVLYPKLVSGGFLIIDDYGHHMGCKKAVDEYFTKIRVNPIFEQIDYTGVLHVKNKEENTWAI